MNTRRRPNMRRLVDNVVAFVRSGDLSMEVAARTLLENGVPVSVIGRVLGAAVRAQPVAQPVLSAQSFVSPAFADPKASQRPRHQAV